MKNQSAALGEAAKETTGLGRQIRDQKNQSRSPSRGRSAEPLVRDRIRDHRGPQAPVSR
jgi:hypothetical protein